MEGNPDNKNESYTSELRFQPNFDQREAGIKHVHPVQMHTSEPRKEYDEASKQMKVVLNPNTGNPLRGKIHWCCDTCVNKLEQADDNDTYKCGRCTLPVEKRSVKLKYIILQNIHDKKCAAALPQVKALCARISYDRIVGPAVVTIVRACIQLYTGEKILEYIFGEVFNDTLYESLQTYDPRNLTVNTALLCKNAPVLKMILKAIHDPSDLNCNFLMHNELKICITNGTKNMDIIQVLLNYGTNPLYVDKKTKKTSFRLFLETSRDLDKSMESEHLKTYKMFMKSILRTHDFRQHVDDYMLKQALRPHEPRIRGMRDPDVIDQSLLNSMFGDRDTDFNPYILVGSVAMMRQMSKEYVGGYLFPLHLLVNGMSPMFDFSRFLKDDFESVILPRLKFFQKQNVKIDACENGLTPITSLLNQEYYIESHAVSVWRIPQNIRGYERHLRQDNILKIIIILQAIGVSSLQKFSGSDICAIDVLFDLTLQSWDYKENIMSKLGWNSEHVLKSWPLNEDGSISEIFKTRNTIHLPLDLQ
jgi:hypothetical protein